MQNPEKRRLKRKIVAKKRKRQQRDILEKVKVERNFVHKVQKKRRQLEAEKHIEIKPVRIATQARVCKAAECTRPARVGSGYCGECKY